MALLSPGTQVIEIDASAIVPTVSNSVAVFAGNFTQGPVGIYSLITNEQDLIKIYGTPTNENFNEWFQARTFLNYGNSLLVSRAVSTTSYNAATTADMLQIGNVIQFETEYVNIVQDVDNTLPLEFIARNPGTWGNSIEIAIAKPELFAAARNTEVFTGVELTSLFEYVPESNEFAVIVKANGKIVETYIASLDENAKDFNNKSLFVETVINARSEYVFVKAFTGTIVNNVASANLNGTTIVIDTPLTLTGGSLNSASTGDIETAYMLWDNKEEIDIDIVISNELAPAGAINLVNARKDCIAFVGAPTDIVVGVNSVTAVANLLNWRSTVLQDNMFVCAIANAIYIYDKFTDRNRWVNVAGSIAGLRAQTSTNRASWFASAGLERGKILNVLKLAFNPDVAKRDMLYKIGLNPVVAFPGTGAVMWGQKTLQSKASSSNIIVLDKLIAA